MHQTWNSAARNLITQKLNSCATKLHKWSEATCHQTRKDIERYRRKLEAARTQVDDTNYHHYNELRKKLDFLLVKDDLFWRQRAKTFWYRDGDLNTRFFHATATTRKKKNQIVQLEDPQGNICNSADGLKTIAKDYFTDIFQQQQGDRMSVLNAVTSSVSTEDNNILTVPFSIAEFKDAAFSMEADKCPGPDGFNPGFYQQFWDLCGHEIFEAGCSWLECGAFPPGLNSTNIALIPKGESQKSMKDWRPISLCNVLYKIVAKVLANRLKPMLDKCISENQSAFVPGRSILDNAMAAIEIIHYMKAKTRGKKCWLHLRQFHTKILFLVLVIKKKKTSVSIEDNNVLTTPFSIIEFKDAVFSMEADKCPGPDGFNPGFYQQFWDLCGHEIF
jgi:hypothetical protein